MPLDVQNADVAAFLYEKQTLDEFFARYVAGVGVFPGRSQYVVRVNDLREKRILGAWENIYNADLPVALLPPPMTREIPGQGGATGRASLITEFEKQEALQSFRTASFNVRILRTLGYGGNGIAFLCEALGTGFTPNRGSPRKFVLKYDAGMIGMDDEKHLTMVRTGFSLPPLSSFF